VLGGASESRIVEPAVEVSAPGDSGAYPSTASIASIGNEPEHKE
jgi:hypothetical protein